MISLYSQLLIRSYSGPLNADASRFVDHIVIGTERIRELLSDLLAFAEVGTEMEGEAEVLDLNSVLAKVKQSLLHSVLESGTEIIADPLPTIRGYERHFIAVFQNLISNSIKYRGESHPRIRISVGEAKGMLQFKVTDNGIGIPPEFHEKVFMAFKRLNGRQIPGTGIGLAICQRVVERYGGRIWVQSETGGGTTFLFTLPRDLQLEERNLLATGQPDASNAGRR